MRSAYPGPPAIPRAPTRNAKTSKKEPVSSQASNGGSPGDFLRPSFGPVVLSPSCERGPPGELSRTPVPRWDPRRCWRNKPVHGDVANLSEWSRSTQRRGPPHWMRFLSGSHVPLDPLPRPRGARACSRFTKGPTEREPHREGALCWPKLHEAGTVLYLSLRPQWPSPRPGTHGELCEHYWGEGCGKERENPTFPTS